MRIDDVLYFSPQVKVIDLEMNNKEQILHGFKDRIFSYYLDAANQLNHLGYAFASGVILMSAIDAIANYSIGGKNHIKDFIRQSPSLDNFSEDQKKALVKAFDDYFRNGLVHEGRVKNGGQFSYEYPFLYFDNGFLIINPRLLHSEVVTYFENYIKLISKDEGAYAVFYQKFSRQFKPEIDALKEIFLNKEAIE
ncbi:hypothetical protein [Ferruginibacter sp.]